MLIWMMARVTTQWMTRTRSMMMKMSTEASMTWLLLEVSLALRDKVELVNLLKRKRRRKRRRRRRSQ
jgi:hypothetical protein